MNDEFIKKLQSVETKISTKKGSFQLFALFLRTDAINKWDLIVAAPWLKRNDLEALKLFAELLKNELKNNIIEISKVVIIDEKNPALKAFNMFNIEHGKIELQNVTLFGLEVRHAYIIT